MYASFPFLAGGNPSQKLAVNQKLLQQAPHEAVIQSAYRHSLAQPVPWKHTIQHNLLREVVHIAATLHVFPQIQIPAAGPQQVCHVLIIDLQEAALHAEPQLVSALQHQAQPLSSGKGEVRWAGV